MARDEAGLEQKSMTGMTPRDMNRWGWIGVGAADGDQALAAVTTRDPSGALLLRPEIASLTLAGLPQMAATPVGATPLSDVQISPLLPGDTRQPASTWVNSQLALGNVVLIGSTAGVLGVVVPVEGVPRLLKAVLPSAVVESTTGGLYAVLAAPAPSAVKASSFLGVSGVAMIAGAVAIGLVVVFAGKKKRRGL